MQHCKALCKFHTNVTSPQILEIFHNRSSQWDIRLERGNKSLAFSIFPVTVFHHNQIFGRSIGQKIYIDWSFKKTVTISDKPTWFSLKKIFISDCGRYFESVPHDGTTCGKKWFFDTRSLGLSYKWKACVIILSSSAGCALLRKYMFIIAVGKKIGKPIGEEKWSWLVLNALFGSARISKDGKSSMNGAR